jgi:predicted RNA-binding protein with PIN domain
MDIIIDGYNLVGKLNRISLSDRDKEEKLVSLLSANPLLKRHPITVVFDGSCPHSPWGSKRMVGSITTVFTVSDKTADAVIIDYITEKSSPLLIVSSDNQIRRYAKVNHKKTISSEDFIQKYKVGSNHTTETVELEPYIGDTDDWMATFDASKKI